MKLKNVQESFEIGWKKPIEDLIERLKEYPTDSTIYVDQDILFVNYARPFTTEELIFNKVQEETNTKQELERRKKLYEELKEEFE